MRVIYIYRERERERLTISPSVEWAVSVPKDNARVRHREYQDFA